MDVSTTVEDYTPRRVAGSDVALPASFTVTASDAIRGTTAVVEVEVDDEGRAAVRHVGVGGDDVAMVDLRAVKLPQVVRAGMERVAMLVVAETSTGLVVRDAAGSDPVDLDALLALAMESEPAPPGRQPVTPERLAKVAKLYRAATSGTFPGQGGPTAMVGRSLGVSRSQAAALVQRAREDGFLGPAPRGKAGER
jgi:hypothetical protein